MTLFSTLSASIRLRFDFLRFLHGIAAHLV